MLIVPTVGVTTVGFGSTNLGVISKYHHPDYGSQEEYMSSVGVNTYFARSILDVGTASTSMNSYFIPPSLTETQINVVSNLWQNPSGFGTITSKKVTPNGLVPGGLLYNSTRDKIQVRNTASSFRNLSPIVAMGWVAEDGTISTDRSYGFDTSSNIRSGSTNNYEYTWTFETQQPDTNYFVMVNHQGGSSSSFKIGLAYTETVTSFKSAMQDSANDKQNSAHSVVVMRVS